VPQKSRTETIWHPLTHFSPYQLAADTELPVKNGAELLDRLIKDIVTEQASHYVSTGHPTYPLSPTLTLDKQADDRPRTAFSLERFIPLLKERINVINPFTRMYLVQWLTVLDSVPELELVSYLPDFLEGLIGFLGDPTSEIRTATQNVLADFLREIREVADVQREQEESWESKQTRLKEKELRASRSTTTFEADSTRSVTADGSTSDIDAPPSSIDSPIFPDPDEQSQDSPLPTKDSTVEEEGEDIDDGIGAWTPGQGVVVKHGEIVEILLKQMMFTGPEADREIQASCMRWIAEFLNFAQSVILSFTPRLIPLVMSALAHHVPSLRSAAHHLNESLFHVISELPSPPLPSAAASQQKAKRRGSQESLGSLDQPSAGASKERASPIASSTTNTTTVPFPTASTTASKSPQNTPKLSAQYWQADSSPAHPEVEQDPFDYQATVGALCTLLGVEEEESRLAALHWLSMLHQKAPRKVSGYVYTFRKVLWLTEIRVTRKILSLDDGTFPALLKTLSDPSEEVIKSDLQLLAQISSSSDEEYFTSFMVNLVRLFSTDRSLLEFRGRTIIGQLCVSLNTERIFRTFAEILEKDEVRDNDDFLAIFRLMCNTGLGVCEPDGAEPELISHHLARIGGFQEASEKYRYQSKFFFTKKFILC